MTEGTSVTAIRTANRLIARINHGRIAVTLAVLLALIGPGAWSVTGAQGADSFESDQFGYTVEWDEPWRANEPIVIEDFEVLAIFDGASFVSLTAITADWFGLGFEDAAEVYDFFLDGLLDESADAELLDGDRDADVPWAEASYSREDEAVRARIEIFTLDGGDAYLYALIEASEDDFEDTLADAATAITLDGDEFLAQGQDGEDDDGADDDQDDRSREDDADDETGDDSEDDTDDTAGDGDGNTYVSPTFGYELEWDDDVWDVESEDTGDRDFLQLIETDRTSLVFVEGYEAYDGDPDDCLEASASEILDQDNTEDVEPLEDDDGEEIAGEDDGVVFAAFTYIVELDDGDPQDRVGYFTCQTLVEDEAVLAFSFVGIADEFEDDFPEWEDLLAGVTLPEAQSEDDDDLDQPIDEDDPDADEDVDSDADDGDRDRDEAEDDRDDDDVALTEGVSYRGGPAHTGEQPGPAPEGEPEVIWSYDTEDDFVGAGAPAVAGGLVFTNSSAVFAVDAETGDEVWTFESDAGVGFVAPLVIADGVLYASGEDGSLYAFEPESGDIIWQSDVGQGLPLNSAPVVAEGAVYVTSWNNNVYGVDAETGDELWDAPIDGITFSHPAYSDGLLVLGDPTTDVIALDAETGEEVWRIATAEQVFSSPAIVDGVVYVGSTDGLVYALNLDDGDEVWTFDAGGPVRSSPAVVGGVVYIGTEAGEILALDAESGDEVWTFEADAAVNGAPVVAPGEDGTLLFAGDDDGHLYVIDVEEGEAVETVTITDAGLFWPAAVTDGVVYVGGRDGVLYALAAD